MTKQELNKLSRSELIQLALTMSARIQTLQAQYNAAEQTIARREIILNNAGSIAEAALQLNGIFDVAQNTAQQYLDNIEALSQRKEVMLRESQEQAGRMLLEAERRCERTESDAKVRCAEMLTKAKAEAQEYWDEVSAKMDAYYESHIGLRELLAATAQNLPRTEIPPTNPWDTP